MGSAVQNAGDLPMDSRWDASTHEWSVGIRGSVVERIWPVAARGPMRYTPLACQARMASVSSAGGSDTVSKPSSAERMCAMTMSTKARVAGDGRLPERVTIANVS